MVLLPGLTSKFARSLVPPLHYEWPSNFNPPHIPFLRMFVIRRVDALEKCPLSSKKQLRAIGNGGKNNFIFPLRLSATTAACFDRINLSVFEAVAPCPP